MSIFWQSLKWQNKGWSNEVSDWSTKLLLTFNEIARAIILTFETLLVQNGWQSDKIVVNDQWNCSCNFYFWNITRAINKEMYSNLYDFLYLLLLWFIIYYIYGSGFHYIYGGYYIYGWLLLHTWLVLLLFSNYWMRLCRMWRIMQIEEDIIGRGG